ncbi:hypothetical protein MNBD_GAMMA15-907 [hydrothermal vent metagenome]|uniref:Homolog of E. coli HemX protein n=1 Tax=hydrothermal vent metagenome TaxID=652676 RepID=A0A3B0Z4M8_9ZZZZ
MSQSETNLPRTTSDENRSNTSPNASRPDAALNRESQRSSPAALVFALLALGASIGLATGGYFIWSQLQQLTGEQAGIEPRLQQRVQPLQTGLQAISKDWQEGRREIEKQLGALDDSQETIGERVNRLASLVGRSELGWTLAEVEYLLRIASESLQLRRDKHTAIAALNSADNRLHELADPQLLPIREKLARELNALREVPDVDFDGLSLRIADSLQQVARLPVSGSRYEPLQPETTSFDATKTADNWKDLTQVIWSSVTQLFRVRDHDKPVTPMLPPERIWFLKENLRLQLAAARLALLREDRKAYQQALTTATEWLKEWFDNEDKAVIAMVAGLEEVAVVDIRPPMPDVSGSLQVLRQLQAQPEVTTNTDEETVSPTQEEVVPVQDNTQ